MADWVAECWTLLTTVHEVSHSFVKIQSVYILVYIHLPTSSHITVALSDEPYRL